MKIPRSLLLSVMLTAAAANAQTVASVYSEAQRAYIAGDTATAKAKFEEVLTTDPSNIGAKNYLKTIQMAEKKSGQGKGVLATQLKTLIVPKVSFKDASLTSVLDYLKAKAGEISGGKTAPSFVLQLPSGYSEKSPITLELANVPFTEVLRYLGELTSTKFQIQEYAIVVTPEG